jgi:hypothetical protein
MSYAHIGELMHAGVVPNNLTVRAWRYMVLRLTDISPYMCAVWLATEQ